MKEELIRTETLLGGEAIDRLARAHVAVFGIGGVGSYCAEALARSGIGALTFVDADTVSRSNINRQLVALHSTVGMPKAEVMAARARDIDPDCSVTGVVAFYNEETADKFDLGEYDYVVDAIDSVSSKLLLICRAKEKNVPVISAMGAGNKLDPSAFEVADIYSTNVCPLARVMRHELKKRGISSLKVVYSREEPLTPVIAQFQENAPGKRQTPGSTAFTPGAAGLLIASEVVKDIAQNRL